jgi:anti-anti-sigma factor
MALDTIREGGLSIVQIPEEVTVKTLEELERDIMDILNTTKEMLALDFRATIFLDSTGLSFLIRLSRKAVLREVELVLVDINEATRSLITLSSMDSLINIVTRHQFDEDILPWFSQ